MALAPFPEVTACCVGDGQLVVTNTLNHFVTVRGLQANREIGVGLL